MESLWKTQTPHEQFWRRLLRDRLLHSHHRLEQERHRQFHLRATYHYVHERYVWVRFN